MTRDPVQKVARQLSVKNVVGVSRCGQQAAGSRKSRPRS